MSQELVETNSSKAIEAQRVSARVGVLHASIERDPHYRYTLPAPLTPSVRKELEAYRRDLHARLRPIAMAQAEQATVRKGLAMLLQSYPSTRGDPAATLDAYCAMLRDQPVWAILAALGDFRDGNVYDVNSQGDRVRFTLDHAPSAARILDQSKKHTDSVVEERGKVTRLLSITRIAPPEGTPEMREKIGKLLTDLAVGMAAGADSERQLDREKARAEAQSARERAARIVEEATRRRRAESNAG